MSISSLRTSADAQNISEITLTVGDAREIVEAIKKLGGSLSTQARAAQSFLVKIPHATIRKIDNGFSIGESFLPEEPQHNAKNLQQTYNRRATDILAA